MLKILADSIMKGLKGHPQAFGVSNDRNGGTCTAMAAIDGGFNFNLAQPFPLQECPEGCPSLGIPDHQLFAGIIPHLNDYHRWSREKIAGWLLALHEEQEALKSLPSDEEFNAVATAAEPKPVTAYEQAVMELETLAEKLEARHD